MSCAPEQAAIANPKQAMHVCTYFSEEAKFQAIQLSSKLIHACMDGGDNFPKSLYRCVEPCPFLTHKHVCSVNIMYMCTVLCPLSRQLVWNKYERPAAAN